MMQWGSTWFTMRGNRGYAGAPMVLLTVFSAVLLPLALPNELFPWGAALPGVVALVPLFLAIRMCGHWRSAARLGVLFGGISTALGSYWLAFFGDFSVWTIGGAVLGYMLYNYVLFGFLYAATHGGARWYRPVRLALLWTGYEYLKSVGFLGYPWGLVAYPLTGWTAVAQGAELLGVWGLSFLGAYLNSAVAEVVPRERLPGGPGSRGSQGIPRLFNHVIASGALLGVVALFGVYQIQTIHPSSSFRALVVQQNVDSWAPGRFADALEQAQAITLRELARHEERTGGSAPPDVVVWSETALRRPYSPHDAFFHTTPETMPFTLFLRTIGVPLVTGAPMASSQDSWDMTNSALVISPDGDLVGSYAKQQLVPFAESIPLWHLPAVRSFFRDTVGLYGTWVPGRTSNPVTIPLGNGESIAAGLPICFEDAFSWVTREKALAGAQVLVNLTNNSWSRQDSAQTQHMVAARLRSIELRMATVRGTNSGFSGVVDAAGRVTDSLPMFEATAAVMEVPVYSPRWTLYRAIGDLFGIVSVVVSLAWVILRCGRRESAYGPHCRAPAIIP